MNSPIIGMMKTREAVPNSSDVPFCLRRCCACILRSLLEEVARIHAIPGEAAQAQVRGLKIYFDDVNRLLVDQRRLSVAAGLPEVLHVGLSRIRNFGM